MPVSRIFAEHGEIKFRGAGAAGHVKAPGRRPPAVIAPGGGWICPAGRA